VRKQLSNTITTDRLFCRHFIDADASFLVQLLNSESWLKFIGDRNVHDEDEALQYLQRSAYKAIDLYGYAMMRISLINCDTPIGMCGLFKRDELDLPDLGFAFLPQYEGKGYAFEASEAVIKHAQQFLGISELYAITGADNQRSITLLNKLGFAHTEQRYNKEFDEQLDLYKRENTL
jgi:[ribosomal protein S5]-alanine N-acetyltransferase